MFPEFHYQEQTVPTSISQSEQEEIKQMKKVVSGNGFLSGDNSKKVSLPTNAKTGSFTVCITIEMVSHTEKMRFRKKWTVILPRQRTTYSKIRNWCEGSDPASGFHQW